MYPSQRQKISDNFRYFAGKYWINLAHDLGPQGGLQEFALERRNARDPSPMSETDLMAFNNPNPNPDNPDGLSILCYLSRDGNTDFLRQSVVCQY
jgi:hypothetical protein